MGWAAFFVLAGAVALVAVGVWRRWISPWKDVQELADDVATGRQPRKFLVSGNAKARRIGLVLESVVQNRDALEKKLQESEASVQAVFGTMLDGLAVVDERRNTRLINAAFRRCFAVGEEVSGGTLIELTHNAAIDRLVAQAIEKQEATQGAVSIQRGGNEPLELEVAAVPLKENAAGFKGGIVLFHDVTHFRKVEQMRRDFVANVSHELRTPLSILRGYLETLLDEPNQSPGELRRILEVMERHSGRLNSLVEDVLSLARLESPGVQLQTSEIDLPELLHSIVRDWEKRFAEKELKSHLNFPRDIPPLHADETRIQELIYNLLDNAVKYSGPGGTVSLRAEPSNGAVRISVADQGTGIAEPDLPRIFERFYRADKSRAGENGTGLGLAIVKHIAQLHGGTVEAQSEFGKGTTITVVLPTRSGTPRCGVPAGAVTQT